MSGKKRTRRGFLQSGAALAGAPIGGFRPATAQKMAMSDPPMLKANKDQIAYGDRSKYVTSTRVPTMGRMSPDMFGLTFHVTTPLQDQVGIITPSSLFYVATHRGSFIPDINPDEHRLMIHGMVDRPLIFTMDELKRLPSVCRIHFVECLGNRSGPQYKTVQESHGL